MSTAEFPKIIEQFSNKKILVIGDFILDVYLKGTSSRLSPEAPVPVVDVRERVEVAGGAANTAVNLRALGAEVTLLSVIGMDQDGGKAIRLIREAGVDTSRVIRYPKRSTIVKTRVMVGPHVLTRYDCGSEYHVEPEVEQMLLRYVELEYQSYDGIILSDYNKGIITERLLTRLSELQHEFNKYVGVDSKRLTFFKGLNPSFVKPNYEEVLALTGIERRVHARVDQICQLGETLFELTGASATAVTLDAEGAVIFQEGRVVHTACAEAINTPNVVGAGDTFISAFTLSALSGASLEQASTLACAAAAIAVRKEGTATCDNTELIGHFSRGQKMLSSREELAQLCDLYRREGKKVVFTNGCFDILHSGHVSYLNRARQLGDVLILGVNNDESIRRLKGEKRPINPLPDRTQVLAGLKAVDHMIAFGDESDDTPVSIIRIVKPDIFVKGGDYTRESLPEAETVESFGGEVVLLSLVSDHSTTQIIQQIYKTSTLAVA
jgi:D-beta-D-heptose 7-phosphate kinase / D-beta-D-heptose 1-phosphate adenosyltransferase